jgi:hypothetical protein
MSRRIAVVGLGLVVLLLVGVASAKRVAWRPQDKPPVSLSEALALADEELAKHEGKYHCLGASLAQTFSRGDWELIYCTPDGKTLWISVGSDKSVRTSDKGFSYY